MFQVWQIQHTWDRFTRCKQRESMRLKRVLRKKNLEFEIALSANEYMNFNDILICLPIKIKFNVNNANNIATGAIPVNNFFAHWPKEVDMNKNGDDIPILPLKTVEVYKYSSKMLKHVPKKRSKRLKKRYCTVKKRLLQLEIEAEDLTIQVMQMTESTKTLQIE